MRAPPTEREASGSPLEEREGNLLKDWAESMKTKIPLARFGTDNNVTFNYGRKRRELMTLPINEFIHRFLAHIPQPNAILVRCYGLYSANKRGELEKCRGLLGCDSIAEPQKIKWQDCFEDSNDHPELCPICGKRLVMSSIVNPTGMIPYPGAPPLLMPHLKEAA